MKLDRNLYKNKLNSAQRNDFKEFIGTKVKSVDLTKFRKFIISGYGILTIAGIFSLAALLMILSVVGGFHLWLIAVSMIVLVAGIVLTIKRSSTRKIILDESTKELSLEDIAKRWFSYYDVPEEETTLSRKTLGSYYLKLIHAYSKAPSDAKISYKSETLEFNSDGIRTKTIVIQWHWIVVTKTRNGTTYTDYYKNQTYIFDSGFDNKWDDFGFNIYKKSKMFKRKKATLENTLFNKNFNYNYNDEVKLRMLFTVATQEALLEKYVHSDVSMSFDGLVLLTTCANENVARGFTPLELNVGGGVSDEAILRQKVFDDQISDFGILMEVMGHSRFLYSLYKKHN